MKKKHRIILFFGLCALAVVAAMAWQTVEIRKLQAREKTAQERAHVQDLVRRALWRMDSFAQVFVATESARPHLYYNSFFSPEQAYYMERWAPGEWIVACADDYRVPSPLLTAEPEFCKLHFQIEQGPDGGLALGTPRFPPTEENRAFACRTQPITQQDLLRAVGLLKRLEGMARPERLAALARNAVHVPPETHDAPVVSVSGIDTTPFRWPTSRPTVRSVQSEWSQRQQTAQQAYNVQQQVGMPALSMDAQNIKVSSLAPVWLSTDEHAPELVLLRTVRIPRAVGDQELVQGVWVDWPSLRRAMLKTVEDLFPEAQLVPVEGQPDERDCLATIPAVLRPGPPAQAAAYLTSSRSVMLYAAWGAVIAALIAVGVVVRAVFNVLERRARFVSAVTHELRTPLTTFCLYSEMLADGLIRDENAKREYLSTLKRESQRLAKIVENVLCYAKLAEVQATAQVQRVDAFEMVERMIPALARRAAEAGMQLVTDLDQARAATVNVDPQTIERILMNLVDNACKYACGHVIAARGDGEADNRIHLTARAAGDSIEFEVADHGPGIPKSHRRAVFKAFNRANADTAPTAPGLGLGLSLARGLARELGGDLRLGTLPPGFTSGAVLVLTLPATFQEIPEMAASSAA